MLRKTAIEGSNTVTEKLVAEVQPTEHPAFNEFVATIEALRSPDGCPWDKEQTHKSISGNMVEEAYEAVDAIEADDVAHMQRGARRRAASGGAAVANCRGCRRVHHRRRVPQT